MPAHPAQANACKFGFCMVKYLVKVSPKQGRSRVRAVRRRDLEPYAYVRELARQDRLSHAWLLLGEDGEEREKLALFIAQALLCSSPGEKPCGVCPHCRKMRKGIHPDLVTLLRSPDKREIGVKQVRATREEVWITPNEAARKVFMIPEADLLNNEGQNALLKVLEEPPPYAAFLLLGRNPGAFLPTVRSRCLTLRLGGPGEASGESDSAALLAEAFIRGDRLAWMRAAFPCEKLDREKFDRLVEELDTAAALRAKAGEGEARARALRLSALTFRIREMRQVNLSAGQCLGWLCSRFRNDGYRTWTYWYVEQPRR